MFKAPSKLSLLAAPLVWGLGFGLLPAAGAQPVGDGAPSARESGVDASIRPGDDFFAYANGDWL